jgi:glycosyltransferase
MDLISVIVPIYKVESYLHRCVDSILEQTYQYLEIILVDDGSPDNCPTICDEYSKKDERVRVIHKKNGGLSDARNAGMLAATGEYLMFVDSDDWLEKDAVTLLYQLLVEHNAQIAIGGMQRVEDQTNIILQSEFNGEKNVESMTKTQAMKTFFQNGCAAWGRLYHRSVHSGIKFPVGEINEDEAIVLSLLDRCSVVVQTNEIVYNYRCRAESITTSAFSEKKLAWYRHCQDNLRWIQQYHPELAAFAEKRLCSSILWTLREIALSPQNFDEIADSLQQDIRLNYHEFFKCALSRSERRRLLVLRFLPFQIYQRIEQRMS